MPTPKMQSIEQAAGRPIREIIADLYAKHGNQADVAAALGVSPGTLSVWLIRLGLEHWTLVKPVGAVSAEMEPVQ